MVCGLCHGGIRSGMEPETGSIIPCLTSVGLRLGLQRICLLPQCSSAVLHAAGKRRHQPLDKSSLPGIAVNLVTAKPFHDALVR